MKLIRLIFTAATIVAFVLYFIFNADQFRPLLDINIPLLFVIALANLGITATNGFFTVLSLRPFKKHISFAEGYYVSLISSVGNFFATVGAGFGLRGIYLKKRHGLAYSDYLGILSGNFILIFFVNAGMGLLSLWALSETSGPAYYTLMLAFAGIFAGGIALALVRVPAKLQSYIPKNNVLRNVWSIIVRASNGWSRISESPWLVMQMAGVVLLNFFISVFITFVIISSLNLSIDLPRLILFGAIGSLGMFLNITPANLGVKEAIYVFSTSVIGLSVNQVLLIALIDRGVQFVVLLLLWLLVARKKFRGDSSEPAEA